MEAITDLPIPQSFTDVVRGEPTTIAEAVDAYLNDPARLQQWLDSNAARTSNFNYELRHPGHADQSVHNPHKGGAAYAPGGWRPVSSGDMMAADRKVVADSMRKYAPADWDGNPETLTGNNKLTHDTMLANYIQARPSGGQLYQNGNVTVRLPGENPLSKEQSDQFLGDIDKSLAFAPEGMTGKDFPVDIVVTRLPGVQNGEWIGGGDGGLMRISRQDFDLPPLPNTTKAFAISKGKVETWHPVQNTNQRAIYDTTLHELGHATESFATKRNGVALFKRGTPYISAYSRKNGRERYAEHFMAWGLGDRSVETKYLAEKHGWREP